MGMSYIWFQPSASVMFSFSIPVFLSIPFTSMDTYISFSSKSMSGFKSNEDVSSALTPISVGVNTPPRPLRRSLASTRSSIDFGEGTKGATIPSSTPIRFQPFFGFAAIASSVSSAFLPSSVDASMVLTAFFFFFVACVLVWEVGVGVGVSAESRPR